MAKKQLNVIPENIMRQIISLYQGGKSYQEIYSYPDIKKSYILRLRDLGLLVPRTKSESQKLRIKRDGPTKMGQEARTRLSIQQSIKNRGGKSKWFTVGEYKVQGTWEKNIAEKLTELNIKWKKLTVNKDILEYIIDGKIKRYTPDFYLPQYNLYLEIKGYYWGKDRDKMEAVKSQHPNIRIEIIQKDKYEKLMCGELVWL